MKITNRHGLPQLVVELAEYTPVGHRQGDISITECLKPPQMLELERQHDHEIEIDVSDQIPLLVGRLVHDGLAHAAKRRGSLLLAEERLSMKLDGWTVTGQPDAFDMFSLEEGGDLWDWKVLMKPWAIVFGSREADWTAQLNGYAMLLREAGYSARSLAVVPFICTDWDSAKVNDNGYPPAPSYRHPIELWSMEKTAAFFGARIAHHQEARLHHRWPPCSPTERWQRDDEWAVYSATEWKRKNQRVKGVKAMAVFGPGKARGGGQEEAQELAVRTRGVLEYRRGESRRCQDYCNVGRNTNFCAQWVAIRGESESKVANAAVPK